MKDSILLVAMALFLAGCEKTEVKVCESYIQKRLQSPATYKRVEVKSFDEEIASLDAFRSSVGLPPVAESDELAKLEAQLNAGQKISKRQVFITYDADNAFGTPIRGIDTCVFKLTDGALESESSLNGYASQAVLDQMMSELTDRGVVAKSKRKAPPPIGAACCISRH